MAEGQRQPKRVKFLEDRLVGSDGTGAKPVKSLNEYSCSAGECITFVLVTKADQVPGGNDAGGKRKETASGEVFQPDMSYVLFGEDEKIFGYKALKIIVYLHSSGLFAHLDVQYEDMLMSEGGRKKPDDIVGTFKECFGDALVESRSEFVKKMEEFNCTLFADIGGKVLTTARPRPETGPAETSGSSTVYEVMHYPLADHQRTIPLFHRLQPLGFFFIEGFQAIDTDDPRWEVLVALERPERWDGSAGAARVVGYCSIYSFYAFPDTTRLRIAQVLILPPYQRRGHGLRLLQMVYQLARERGCVDVTIEDPTVEMDQLKSVVDSVALLGRPEVQEALQRALRAAGSGSRATGGGANGTVRAQTNLLAMPGLLVETLWHELAITKVQLRRCWEVGLAMRMQGAQDAIGEAFMQLVIQRLELQYFGKKGGRPASEKRLVDTHSTYGVGFIMMRMAKGQQQGTLADHLVGGGEDSAVTGAKVQPGSNGMVGGTHEGQVAEGGRVVGDRDEGRKPQGEAPGAVGDDEGDNEMVEAEEEEGEVAVEAQSPEEAAREKQKKLMELYLLREAELKKLATKVATLLSGASSSGAAAT